MELRLQPKPEVEVFPPHQGIVSREQFFAKKKFEQINEYFFPAHFIRDWKPKAELLYPSVSDETEIQFECDFNRDIQNCFVEDSAEEVYLKTPPPCFVVIGKHGESVSKLSRKLADEFGSVLIEADVIINQLLETQTETAKVLDRLLRLGVSLTLNFVLTLLSYVAHTAEARHRGYVLCGLPRIPQLYDLSVDQQFNYLFTWDNKPTVFINVLFDDEDLIRERTNLRCEILNFEFESRIVFHTEECAENDDDTESVDGEFLTNEEILLNKSDIDISPSRPWIQLPMDEESQVWPELELFDNKIRPAIELLISRVDPQYFITVDSRVQNELDIVLARLKLLQIWKVPVAVPFIPRNLHNVISENVSSLEVETNEVDEEQEKQTLNEFEIDPDIKRVAEEPPQTAFLTLFTKNTISPKFRWELSHYNYICPVSLREGEVIEGKSEFAVVFMKYIYFLRNEESMLKFLQNPRAYVLPIRPLPLNRFIILGYPYCGKTTLGTALATELSIPLLDANTILKADLDRKKSIYQEFCRQKAEWRETIRQNALAWQKWRAEEEHRITLIEEWVAYIQTLLRQRIDQFYCKAESDDLSVLETQMHRSSFEETYDNAQEGSIQSGESTKGEIDSTNLEVCGVGLSLRTTGSAENTSSPSDRLIKAMKHEDFDFNEPNLEVEANLFFSSLWNTFSNKDQRSSSGNISKIEEEGEENVSKIEVEEDYITVDWCSLLPPQSLSCLLMSKVPFTTREKRQSFKVFLEAASKAYWRPCKLKTEFAKWRLPCFMDIPLCEIFLDNPILLLKYVPEWLKERPLIPDPVDPMHPSVLEAGQAAFQKASVVTIKQNKEEKAVLLRDAIEKAEREGMRVTGEVISPGGWVIDNMTLDLDVWKKLACEGVFPDHIYILLDSEPEFRRIINTWSKLNPTLFYDWGSSEEEEEGKDEEKETQGTQSLLTIDKSVTFAQGNDKIKSLESLQMNVIEILRDTVKQKNEDDYELDDIFDRLIDKLGEHQGYIPPTSVDPFSHHMFQNNIKTWSELKEETTEEALLTVHTMTRYDTSFFDAQTLSPLQSIPLGPQLQKFTNAILNTFKKKEEKETEEKQYDKQSIEEGLQFFIYLLTLPEKLQNLKNWLISINRGGLVSEIDVMGTTPNSSLFKIRKELFKDFIKKPRELEEFEMIEILKSERKQKRLLDGESESLDYETEEDVEEEDEAEEDDIRIFGESGPLCIVNLERDIFLLGKPEFSLRYFGKLYYFYDEAAKKAFMLNPQKYAPYYSVIRCYPPLRVYVTGPIGCGKTKLAFSIAQQCGITFVNYYNFIIRHLLPYLDPKGQKFTPLGDSKLLLAENYNAEAKLVKEKFMNVPYDIRQFWFENPIYEEQLEAKNKFRSKVIDLSKPVVVSDFPKLNYECIGEESKSNEEENRLKLSSSLQETPYMSMKDLESLLNGYFQNTSELTDYCVDRSIKYLWTTEPYISQGFVLKGFPTRFSDVKHLIENNWIPDLVLELMLPEDAIVERNIDNFMELWDTQLKQEIIEEKLLEDTLISVQNIWNCVRRNELIAAKRAAISQQFSLSEVRGPNRSRIKKHFGSTVEIQHQLPKEVEEQIEMEVEKVLKDEFRPLSFNPVFETYDSAKTRITENLLKIIRNDIGEIEKIKASFKDLGVPWVELSSFKDVQENKAEAFLLLDKMKRGTNRKGEFAFTLKMETAEKLLQQGYYFLSKFGRWCPVQVYRMKNPIHMFRPLSAKGKVTAIAYRNYIYFVGGENEKIKFIEDPVKYTFNEPHHPNIPVRVAVIGPPKSGKSTLSNRLGRTFDMKVVTMGSALRFVLEKIPNSTLAKSINNYLRRGCFLPLSFKVEALLACLNDPACLTQGFVFDGIPFDAALTQSLAERGKLPFVIISLVSEPNMGKANRQGLDLKEFRLPYKNRVNLDSTYRDWKDTYKRFAQWNQDTYNNLYEVNAKLNVVDIFYQAYDIIRKSFFGILYYVEYCVSNRALPLQYLCVGQHEYELRKSSFHNNCPVCWVLENKLSNCPSPPPRSGLVQYLNYFYWICSKHMEKFLKHPKIYVPPVAPPPPHPLPKMITKNVFESYSPSPKIHGYGRCPVTRIDFPGVLDWEGSWDFAAFYDDKVYLCKNKEMLDRFLSRPWRYNKADTVFEVNRATKSDAIELLGPPKVTSLPPIGFLEQTVADSIHEGLQILGAVRPVYAKLCPSTTGCTFMALYLKVFNKKNLYFWELEKQYLDFMAHNCRAARFRVPPFKRPGAEFGQGDFEANPEEEAESDSSDENDVSIYKRSRDSSSKQDQTCWLDLEAQSDKKMWSAKIQRHDKTKMKLTSDDELLEIPEIPKAQVVLKYQTYSLRPSPLPPVTNCLTYIYSVQPPLKIREKFNYNSLYQPLPLYSSPHPQSLIFSPEKNFSCLLYKESKTDIQSKENLWKGKRTLSDNTVISGKDKAEMDPDLKLMIERFVPRFQLLDKITHVAIPPVPKAVEEDAIVFNPHRDYAYAMLLSEFFHTTHVLRCYEWNESHQYLEFSNVLSKNLGLSDIQVEYFLHPQRTRSMSSRKSMDSYREAFEATAGFWNDLPTEARVPSDENLKKVQEKSSLVNFIHAILLEKLNELFSEISMTSLSYDSYEINVLLTDSDTNEKLPSILIQEILPYPPLPWDIISRPYYAYCSISSVFQTPDLEDIAHERHFSLLDGITEQNDNLRFVRYPSWIRSEQQKLTAAKQSKMSKKILNSNIKQVYVFYDFFNLNWTSFLTYPFSWAYNKDVRGHFCEFHCSEDSPLCKRE